MGKNEGVFWKIVYFLCDKDKSCLELGHYGFKSCSDILEVRNKKIWGHLKRFLDSRWA